MKAGRLAVLVLMVIMGAGVGLLTETEGVGRVTGLEVIRLQALDLRQRIAGESIRDREESQEIVLVLFDSASVRDWPYLSPFPRPFLAELLESLADAGARTIGLDVYLGDLFPVLNELDGGDDRLEAALEHAGNVILVTPLEERDGIPQLALPHPRFLTPAAGVGAAEIPTPFETVRDGVLAVRDGPALAPSFALRLYAHSKSLDTDSILTEASRTGRLDLPGMPPRLGRIPADWQEEGERGFALAFPLRFLGPPSIPGAEDGTFPAFSASLVPTIAQFQPDFFRDRIVLIGTGFHDSDRFRTPFYQSLGGTSTGPDGAVQTTEGELNWMYGVEIHANALQNLLDGTYIHRLPTWGLILVLLVFSGLSAGAVFWQGPGLGAVALMAGAGAVFLLGLWAFLGTVFVLPGRELFALPAPYLWFPVVSPIVASLSSYLGATAFVAVVEGKEKRFIREAFGKYVSSDVVDDIARSPEALKLGGQKRVLSVLFSDLAGFTSLSEQLEPEALVAVLNEYLSSMTRVVMEEGGTLDKYIGDAIMAFWNAPRDQSDHADRALRTALRMQVLLAALNRRWAEEKTHSSSFRVRIGVNTASVVVGNVGGEDRFDYSAIGDGVNLAARLEPANDTYGTLILTSQQTLDLTTPGLFRVREVDLVAVKGRSEQVRIFEVLGLWGEPQPEARALALECYDEGWKAYRNRDWEGAAKAFQQALEADPEDGPSGVHLGRCRGFMEEPPSPDWDFVIRRKVK
ncbi:MAG: CHASE2 domain-containing protein [Gemmatimonadota bacterium]